jgi:deoxyribonuclease-4
LPRSTSGRSRPPLLGAHVPVAKGLVRQGIAYAEEVGAEAIQVFTSNPRGWQPSPGDPAEDNAFRDAAGARGWPVFVHAPYLINLGSPSEPTAEKSSEALIHTLGRAARIGARGVVLHSGTATVLPRGTPAADHDEAALARLSKRLRPILDAVPDDGPRLLIEPTAGGGRPLCAAVEGLEPYLAALEHHPNLGVCLDTCHAYAAGEDLRAPGGVDAVLRRIAQLAGPDALALVHANDSKDPLGSNRDRHETLGAGTIGTEAFRILVTHPLLADVPIVVETPGGAEQHATDISLLRGFAQPRPA